MASALTLVSVHVGLALRHVQPFSSGARTGMSTRPAKAFNTGPCERARTLSRCPLSGVKRVWSLILSSFINFINELLAKHSIAISEKAMS